MRTVMECLAKAAEMDERAKQCAMLKTRAEFLAAAMHWRNLARRALIHDQLRALDQFEP